MSVDTKYLRERLDQFPEINLNNYNYDDVAALNQWGIEIALVLDELLDAFDERDRLREALTKIAAGDPANIRSPIGPLHAAGIAFQWETTAKIARAALENKP